MEGASPAGSGVLVLLRHVERLSPGVYAIIAPGDSTTVPGALVAARHVTGDVAQGFALDSGGVEVEDAGGSVSARVNGAGLEGTVRLRLQAEFSDVPVAADSAWCRFQ